VPRSACSTWTAFSAANTWPSTSSPRRLEKGFGFCDVTLGWDSNDQLYDNVAFTGWHTAYPDAEVRLLPETLREMPFEGGMPLILGEFAGPAEAICPRGLLRRVLDRAAGHGWNVKAAAEFEFFLFAETPQSVRDKNYRDLQPITPGNFGYSMLRSGVHSGFYHELWSTCESDVPRPRRPAHRDRSGRDRGGDPLRRRARRRRQGRPVQDDRQDPRPAARLDGDLHGKMVARLAGPVGHLHVSMTDAKTGRPIFYEANADSP
jgi:glutamine synthetase